MTKNTIKTVLPIFNSEEKVDEINRLLDILSKRKRYSILVAMLLVFQKYNFQKLLKEFLVEGVQEIILANPFKVVSFGGVPFTIKNCFMGMRVIIGKHRIFQKELLEGYEYLNVNLVYTCIFLTDEIAKICKGSKNHKPVHSSLLDELDIIENNNNNNANNTTQSGSNTASLGSNNVNNYTQNHSNTSSNNNNLLNEKRKRSYNNNNNNSEDEEMEEEQEEEEEEEEDNYSKDSGYKEKNTSNGKKNNKNNKKSNKNNKNSSKNKEMQTKASNNEAHQKEKKAKPNENLINLCDSEESDEQTKKNNKNNNHTKNKNNNQKKNNKNAEKENNPINQLFANIFYPKDVNYFKCSIQDFLTVWNFDKSSPVNVYLKDNFQNISKIKNVFDIMQNIGAKGQNFLEKLIKYIPELNNAASIPEEEKEKINENEDLKESKEILDSINSINSIYKEYENKKKKLINIYQRIKSTAENIKVGAISEGKLMMKEDFEYLDMINKRFDQIMGEIIPLFNQLCDYNKECLLKNISTNLQNVSRNLKENDLTLKSFSIFTQNLVQLFPHEPSNINTVNDLLLSESMSVKEREQIFRDIISREKNILLNSIEQYNIYQENNNKKNNENNENENSKEECAMED